MVDHLLSGALYPHGLDLENVEAWPDADGIVLIIPARYFVDRTVEISEAISRYRWVLAFRCGDEEDLFDISQVRHPNIRWLVQTPRVGKDYGDARFIPIGYPPHFSGLIEAGKSLDVVLVGQRTHERRDQAFDALTHVVRPKYVQATDGFTKGLQPAEYAHLMTMAKVAPCPAGPASPDTFRACEALEAHAIPILDDIAATGDGYGYWERMFPGSPLPILTDYASLPGYIGDALADYPRNANRITAWWIAQKRAMGAWLREDLAALTAPTPDERSLITVLISVSPIPSHPGLAIIEDTIESVRAAQLPESEIILMFDGVRPEQESRRADYEEHIRRVLWMADHQWGNVLPLIADDHLHQAVCTKRALAQVHTPLLLFMEHDTPLTDGEIPWDDITGTVLHGDANVVRLHHEASILAPHKHLMLDTEPQKVRGVPMMRTVQWSQRPHIASTAWYRELLDRWFPNDERDFIEDSVYGRLIAAHERDGDMGWLGWRTWIYTPEGNIQRSYHTDGRAGEDKFDA